MSSRCENVKSTLNLPPHTSSLSIARVARVSWVKKITNSAPNDSRLSRNVIKKIRNGNGNTNTQLERYFKRASERRKMKTVWHSALIQASSFFFVIRIPFIDKLPLNWILKLIFIDSWFPYNLPSISRSSLHSSISSLSVILKYTLEMNTSMWIRRKFL